MPKYRVPLSGYAEATIDVEAPEGTDPEEIVELALMQGGPSICAQCIGWGGEWSLDISDEWEPVADKDGTLQIYRLEDE